MDEKLIDELFNRAVSFGYKKSREEFISLLGSDDEVYTDMMSYARSKGLANDPTEFDTLIGKSDKKKVQSLVLSEELKKQKPVQAPAMASSLQGGSLESQGYPKPLIPQQRPVADVTYRKAPIETTEQFGQVAMGEAKKEEAVPEFVKPLIETVTPELTKKREEDVVPQLNYQFGSLGFKFKESGIGDYVEATAPNGKKINISVDEMDVNEATKLRNFIRNNTISMPEARLKEIEKQYSAENKKFTSDKEVEGSIAQLSTQANQLNKDIQDYYISTKLLEEQGKKLASLSEEDPNREVLVQQYIAERDRLQKQIESISKRQENINNNKAQLDAAVGKYTAMKADQGTWYGEVINAPLRGIGNIISGGYGQMVDILEETAQPLREFTGDKATMDAYIKYAKEEGIATPKADENGNISRTAFKDWLSSIGDKASEYRGKFVDERKKEEKYKIVDGKPLADILRGIVVEGIGMENTEEYTAEARKGLVPRALLGALESVPSFAFGNAASRAARMFLQTDDAIMKEMQDDPDFKNISEREKRMISTPIALAGAALEEIGFRNIIANKGLLNKMTMSALGKAGATTTAKTFGDLVKNEVESGLARGTLTIVGGALAEAETGAAQQAAEFVIKDVYNLIKDKRNENGEYMKMFDTPDSFGEYAKDVAIAGLEEAIGGFVLGMPSAISAAARAKGFEGMDDTTFELFEAASKDENIEKAYVTRLKNQINSGEITIEQAKDNLNEYRKARGLFQSVPENLDLQGKKKAMNLLRERQELESSIQGKDEALTKPQRDRIKTINEELTKISEDAVQKQATDEGVLRSQRSQLGLQEMGEGDKEPQVTPARTQEALAPEEEKRKIDLQEALKSPNLEQNTVTIGQQVLNVADAQKELDTILEKEVSLKTPEVKTEEAKVAPIDFSKQLEEKYGVAVDLLGDLESDKPLSLSRIVVPEEKRNQGVGSQVMKEIIEYADRNNKKLALTPSTDFGGESVQMLKDFYKQFGFVENKGNNKDFTIKDSMYRIPEVSLKTPEAPAEVTEGEVTPADMGAVEEGASVPIGSPEVITKSRKGTPNKFSDKPSPLSFVTIKDKIDINKLIEEIIEKKQKVWFWMADQLGRGNYYDSVIEGYHYLDAGPSFALDPENRSKGVLWASGLPMKVLENQVAKADYIFFISGSPEKAKLFNRRVLDLIAERINKTSSFDAFKQAMNSFGKETNELKDIKDALNSVNSFEELAKSPKRKQFLLAIGEVNRLKTMPKGSLKELLNSFNVFIDYNELRDGFFKDNDFKQNDIMLVGKPTGVGGTAPHSTYQTSILGEVVGVPDMKIDAWEIMPQAVKDKYSKLVAGKEEKTKTLQTKVIAAEQGIVRELEAEPTTKARVQYGLPVTNTQGVSDLEASIADDKKKMSVIDAIKKVTNLFKSLFPNAEIYIYESEDDFNAYASSIGAGKGDLGLFTYKKNPDGSYVARIDINLSKADATTVYHEVAHAVMLKAFGDNQALFVKFKNQISKALKQSTVGYLNAFASQYNDKVAPEEWLVEMSALLSTTGATIKIDTITKIAAIVNKFVSDLTNGLVKPFSETASKKEVIEFFNQMASSIRTGQEIDLSKQKIAKPADLSNITRKEAARVETGPEGLPGYNKLIDDVVNTVIPNAIKRKLTGQELVDLVNRFVTRSDVYKKADDIQKDAIVRAVNGLIGESYKEPPSVAKILGKIKDIAKITVSEKDQIKFQFKVFAKGAKTWAKITKEVAETISDLASTGKITPKQLSAVLSRFAKVSMFDDGSIDRFVDYMAKVFAKAEYLDQIAAVNKALPTAKKNIETKLGISKNLIPVLRKLLAIKPNLIPDALFEDYANLVSMMGERRAVLNLQESGAVMDTASKILNAVEEEQSLAYELADMYNDYADKVLDDNGDVDYAETIKKMLADGKITASDLDVMKKYRSIISPREGAVPMTEQELADEKNELINFVLDADIDAETLPSRDERNAARKLNELKNTNALNSLTNNELKNLLRVINNINNGFLPHYAQLMIEKLESIPNAKKVENSIKKAKLLPFSKIYAKLKSLLIKGRKDAITLMFERNPIYYYDQILGDFNTKSVYDATFKIIGSAYASFDSFVKSKQKTIDNAFDKVSKSFKNKGNDVLMSKYKMTAYLLQLEYLSNPESNKVNPAIDFLDATIKKIRKNQTTYSERDAEMLQEIIDKYAPDGEIDIDKLYNSFNQAEKDAIETIQDINAEMTEKAEYIAGVLRGEKFTPINNYIHHDVMVESSVTDSMADADAISNFNSRMNPSTRAKSLMERTPGAKAIEFDITKSVKQAVSSQAMDYYLTAPIRTVRKTLNEAEKMLDADRTVTSEQNKIFNAVKSGIERSIETTLISSFSEGTFVEDVANEISRQGYRAVLASVPRFIGELIGNVSGALTVYTNEFARGVGLTDIYSSPDGVDVLRNVKSTAVTRLYKEDALSGRMIDASILNQTSGIKGGRAKNAIADKLQQIYNNTLKKYKNSVELVADTLISTPDKLVIRPVWFGVFDSAFEQETGEKPDYDKIADNDEQYMTENAEAIKSATDKADDASVKIGGTDNPFLGILKGTATRNQSAWAKAFNNFNNFMSKFLIGDFAAARTGIHAAIKGGTISRAEGARLLAAITIRSTVYMTLVPMISNLLTKMVWGNDDEEEEDEKSFLQKLGQGMASVFTSLTFGRDFGNATKNLINYGVEKFNVEYLDFLRNGEYDPYKDAIQYSILPVTEEQAATTSVMDIASKLGGSMSPALQTGALIVEKGILKRGMPTAEEKEPETLKQLIKQSLGLKGKKEEYEETRGKEVGVRIPFEVLGNLGYIPLYKDTRKVVLKEIYKDLEKGKKDLKDKKELEKLLLQGYENKSDMRRYDPDMYETTFGKNGIYNLLDVEKYRDKLIDDVIDDIVRDLKDDIYQYTPKSNSDKFGGGAFGGKKKKSTFGGGKFGQ
jgi:GNAT superfamily N-acetyltransferase